METCVGDILYEYDNCNKIYLKTILLCGILKTGHHFVKEIVYNYPTKRTQNTTSSSSSSLALGVSSTTSSGNIDYCIAGAAAAAAAAAGSGVANFGNLDIKNKDNELTNALRQFKVLVVNSATDVAYFKEYCSPETIVTVTQAGIIQQQQQQQCNGVRG